MDKYRSNPKEYRKEYRKKNPEKIRKYRNDYIRDNPWMRNLENAKQRCSNTKNKGYKYYGAKGIQCLLTVDDTKFLWERDNACQMEQPSLDRINPKGNYTLDNCQFIEMIDNVKKCKTKGGVIPIYQLDLSGKIIRAWNTQKEASRFLGISKENISKCVRGLRNQCGGFKWKRI